MLLSKSVRIEKLLSDVCITSSRSDAKKLIKSGAVCINEAKAHVGDKFDLQKDKLYIEETLVDTGQKHIHLVLYKPQDVITSRFDKEGRHTVFDYLPELIRDKINPIGRLDYDTTGLLLFTSDGNVIKQFTHPKFHVEKEYRVTLDKIIALEDITRIENGVELDFGITKPARIKDISTVEGKSELSLIISEGKYHQVKRMFGKLGYLVTQLHRARVGRYTLDDIQPGTYRILDALEP